MPLWSLIVEDALYACLALLFVFGMHRKVWVTLPILACLIISSSRITDAMTDYRLFQTSIAFFTGNLVYIFHDRVRRIPWWIPAVAVAASLMGWLDFTGRVGFPFLIASVIVLAITLPQIRWGIPDLSYGTYIWHGPLMMYLLANVAMARAMPWVITTSALTLGAGPTLVVSRRETRVAIKERLARIFTASRNGPTGYRQPNGRRTAGCLIS